MNLRDDSFYRPKINRTNYPEWRDQILSFESNDESIRPRSYPGYPRWPLQFLAPRLWPSLDQQLKRRRSPRELSNEMVTRRGLSRILQFAHGVNADRARGPTPSAGGLQALELYLVAFESSWLPCGHYHYDRVGHHLSQITAPTSRADWQARVPSLGMLKGGALLFLLIGDAALVASKYAEHNYRFLLLEAGHLAQNLCLLTTSLGFCGVPLGGFFEREISRLLFLPKRDLVLGLVLCGKPKQFD